MKNQKNNYLVVDSAVWIGGIRYEKGAVLSLTKRAARHLLMMGRIKLEAESVAATRKSVDKKESKKGDKQ